MSVKSLALCAVLMAGPAAAGGRVDERRPAAADGTVAIEVGGGAVRVVGWEKAEVTVTGSLGGDAERVDVRGDRRKMRIEVAREHHDQPGTADLQIHVPAGSRVEVESFQAAVSVEGVTGSVRAETVNGSITFSGAAGDVRLESVNGGITVRGRSSRIQVQSVNGPVNVSDPGGDLQAGTVNGPLKVSAAPGLARGHLESVNGRVSFDGQLAARGTLEVENVGGAVDLAISSPADYRVSTFNGAIVNEIGPPARKPHDEDLGPGLELIFSVGGGGAQVSVTTLNGRVQLLKSR
jgi:hypothetical protein